MLNKILLYTIAFVYPSSWLINWFFDSATPGDFAERLLFSIIFAVTGTLCDSPRKEVRKICINIIPALVFSITYHSLYKCYSTVFSLEYVSLSYMVFILSALSFSNSILLITYVLLTILGNFVASVLTLPRVQFFHHFIPAILSYLAVLVVLRLKIKQKDILVLNEKYIEENILPNPIGVIITDEEFRLQYINDIGKKILNVGFRDEFLYGSKILFPVTSTQMQTGEQTQVEIAGDRILDLRYIKSEWMSVPGFLILVKEVTEEMKQKKESERILKLQETAVHSLGEGILCLNHEGIVTFVNPNACKLLDLEREELLGEFFHSKVHHTSQEGTSYEEENFPVRDTYTEGKPSHVSTDIFWKKDGTFFPVEYTSNPIYNNEKLEGAVVIFRDTSERKRRERLDEEYRDGLHYLSSTSNQFLEIFTETELYSFISREMQEITGASATIVNSYNLELSSFTTEAHTGIQSNFTEVYGILGRELKNLTYKIDLNDPTLDLYYKHHTEKIIDGLFTMKYGNFSHTICIEIEKIFKTKEVFSFPLIYKDILFGNILLLFPDTPKFNKQKQETFLGQSSINLYRKRMETEKNRNRFRFDPFIRETSALYMEIKLDGTILFINPALEEAVGYSLREVEGKIWWNLFQIGDSYTEVQNFVRELKIAPKKNFQKEIISKKGYRLKVRWDFIYKIDPETDDEIITGLGLEAFY
ncbi:MAG: PAS domain-containing protein [Leptospiraceae bacterium]|nr:PAS domain-containing protein [Leptospiraceae bacterium]